MAGDEVSFIWALFNDAVTQSDYTASSDWMVVNNELERTWKEAVVALFKVLFRHWAWGTEESIENFSQDSRCPDRDSKRASPEYGLEALLREPTCSVMIPIFYRSFISVLTIFCQMNPIHILIFILMLSYRLLHGLSNVLFPSGILTKMFYGCIVFAMHASCPAYLLLDLIVLIIFTVICFLDIIQRPNFLMSKIDFYSYTIFSNLQN
jgi:hypothetical protein